MLSSVSATSEATKLDVVVKLNGEMSRVLRDQAPRGIGRYISSSLRMKGALKL